MRRVLAIATLALAGLLLASWSTYAEPGPGSSPAGIQFVPGKLQKVTGRVTSVRSDETCGPAMTSVQIDADGSKRWVHLGPEPYLAERGVMIRAGDKVTVQGFPVTFGEGSLLIAKVVMTDRVEVNLLDGEGFPVWSDRGRVLGSFQGKTPEDWRESHRGMPLEGRIEQGHSCGA